MVDTGALPSDPFSVTVAAPACPAAGVIATSNVRDVAVVLTTETPMPPSGSSVVFEEAAVSARLDPAVSMSLIVTVVCAVRPFAMVPETGVRVMVGASFTAVTVSVNGSLAVCEPSLTVTVMVAVPFWFAAGVTMSVRAPPEPPSVSAVGLFGTRVGFDEVAVTVRLEAAVSASSTVKAIVEVDASSAMVTLPIALIVGGVPLLTACRQFAIVSAALLIDRTLSCCTAVPVGALL